MTPSTRNRTFRTLLQAIVGGGFAPLVAELADLSGTWRGVVTAGGVLVVAVAQNLLEDAQKIDDRRR